MKVPIEHNQINLGNKEHGLAFYEQEPHHILNQWSEYLLSVG